MRPMHKPGDTTVTRYEQYAITRLEEAPELGDLIAYDSPYQFPQDVIGNKRR